MNLGQCPKCDKTIANVNVNGGEGMVEFTTKWKVITLCCPSCHAILGAQIDPVALKADIVEEIGDMLG